MTSKNKPTRRCACGGRLEPYVDTFEGEDLQALRCDVCGEVSYTLEQARAAFTRVRLTLVREVLGVVLKIRKTSGNTVEATTTDAVTGVLDPVPMN